MLLDISSYNIAPWRRHENWWEQTTNLGVGGSNPSGRATHDTDTTGFYPPSQNRPRLKAPFSLGFSLGKFSRPSVQARLFWRIPSGPGSRRVAPGATPINLAVI